MRKSKGPEDVYHEGHWYRSWKRQWYYWDASKPKDNWVYSTEWNKGAGTSRGRSNSATSARRAQTPMDRARSQIVKVKKEAANKCEQAFGFTDARAMALRAEANQLQDEYRQTMPLADQCRALKSSLDAHRDNVTRL